MTRITEIDKLLDGLPSRSIMFFPTMFDNVETTKKVPQSVVETDTRGDGTRQLEGAEAPPLLSS